MRRERLHNQIVFELEFAARVDRGLVRERNQDVARVVPRLGLALVADGMGGHERGDVASQTAADGLEEIFARLGGPAPTLETTAERLEQAFRDANTRLAGSPGGSEGTATMGTTLVAAVITSGHAVIGNVGDSRCYRLRGRTLEVLTMDHTFSAELRQQGTTLTPDLERVANRWAHVLTRCLDGEANVEVDLRIVRCEPGDLFLLCSDGLWGSVNDDAIVDVLVRAEDARDACERLIGAAWAGGGLDNIGVAVMRLVPSQVYATDPSWTRSRDRPSIQPSGNV
jgi:PPM family protein phosphatase